MPIPHHSIVKGLADQLIIGDPVGTSIMREAMELLGYHYHKKTKEIQVDGNLWSAEMWTETDDEDHTRKRVFIVHNHTLRVWYMGKFRGKDAPTFNHALALTLHQPPHQGEPNHDVILRRSHSRSPSLEWNAVGEELEDARQILLEEYE